MALQLFAFVDVQESMEFCPLRIESGFAVRVTVGAGCTISAGLMVIVSVSVSVPHSFVADMETLNVPCSVGVPEMVFPLQLIPAGRDEVATEKVTGLLEEAVIVYENPLPTLPVAVRMLVISGNRHCGSVTVTVAVPVALPP